MIRVSRKVKINELIMLEWRHHAIQAAVHPQSRFLPITFLFREIHTLPDVFESLVMQQKMVVTLNVAQLLGHRSSAETRMKPTRGFPYKAGRPI